MPNSYSNIIIGSALILDDSILNGDVNSAAAIEFSKLLCSAINANLTPDVNSTRSLGTGAKAFLNLYVGKADVGAFYNNVDPDADNTKDIGTSSKVWKLLYVNGIEGAAKGQILVNGLLGGL